MAGKKKASGLARATFWLGLFSFLGTIFTGTAALVCGIKVLRRPNSTAKDRRTAGMGMALGALFSIVAISAASVAKVRQSAQVLTSAFQWQYSQGDLRVGNVQAVCHRRRAGEPWTVSVKATFQNWSTTQRIASVLYVTLLQQDGTPLASTHLIPSQSGQRGVVLPRSNETVEVSIRIPSSSTPRIASAYLWADQYVESNGFYFAHSANLGTTDVGDSGDVNEIMAGLLEKLIGDSAAPPSSVRFAGTYVGGPGIGESWADFDRGGEAGGGDFYGGRTPNDDRSDSLNPNNDAYKASMDNRSNQMNPNNKAYR